MRGFAVNAFLVQDQDCDEDHRPLPSKDGRGPIAQHLPKPRDLLTRTVTMRSPGLESFYLSSRYRSRTDVWQKSTMIRTIVASTFTPSVRVRLEAPRPLPRNHWGAETLAEKLLGRRGPRRETSFTKIHLFISSKRRILHYTPLYLHPWLAGGPRPPAPGGEIPTAGTSEVR